MNRLGEDFIINVLVLRNYNITLSFTILISVVLLELFELEDTVKISLTVSMASRLRTWPSTQWHQCFFNPTELNHDIYWN